VSDAVTFAARARAQRLILFHHDPSHDDAQLDELEGAARRSWEEADGDPTTLLMAAEGTTLEL
jgi:phosphoribosyl 1,2-cyclic phosphodiesterase